MNIKEKDKVCPECGSERIEVNEYEEYNPETTAKKLIDWLHTLSEEELDFIIKWSKLKKESDRINKNQLDMGKGNL